MANLKLFALLLSAALLGSGQAQGVERTYIVQMESHPAQSRSSIARRSLHENSLRAVTSRDTMLYSYSAAMNGYSARLTEAEARELMAQPGVKAVSPQKMYQPDTTHSPEFLGLDKAELLGQQGTVVTGNATSSESDIIIGVFDTGVWPESASYDDTGLPPIPSRWKGSCVEGEEFTAANCNKKLIGAKWYSKALVVAYKNANNGTAYNFTGAYQSARDPDGHGTHTSSTAAGSAVENASIFGQALGTARGTAPKARVAMYKVCWPNAGCASADILAALDDAIQDGINVASMSIGGQPSLDADPIYAGTFAAMAKGIFVSVSAGNSGPGAGTVANNVPWVLNVGASTQDRGFPATLVLGDGRNFTGQSLSVNEDGSLAAYKVLPLILASEAAKSNMINTTQASWCGPGSLSKEKVAGKIVVCVRGGSIARVAKGLNVKNAGGSGMVLVNTAAEGGESTLADTHVLPAVYLGATEGAAVLEYAKSAGATGALDIQGAVLGVKAPLMTSFSSRGPNYPAPDLLKPDITGPGVSILAAWPDNVGTSSQDTRRVKFNVISGTSMSCPHLSGIAAFIMSRRPEWSSAAIRSALMTTAYINTKGEESAFIDEATQKAATPFDYGNGHVNVEAALDPGLVYDIKPEDYIDFLCAVNSSTEYVQGISGTASTCPTDKEYSQHNLNYPSFAVGYDTKIDKGPKTVTFNRTVTNVGEPGTYRVDMTLSNPELVQVSVEPGELTFSAEKKEQTFKVTATLVGAGSEADAGKNAWGRLVWSDGSHTVGSSLAFAWGDFATLYSGVIDAPSSGSMRN